MTDLFDALVSERVDDEGHTKMKLFLLCHFYNVTVRRLRFRDLRELDAAAMTATTFHRDAAATPVRPRRPR